MLVAHVEQDGVWLVEGGMHRLAAGSGRTGASQGVAFRYGADVRDGSVVASGRAAGVALADGRADRGRRGRRQCRRRRSSPADCSAAPATRAAPRRRRGRALAVGRDLVALSARDRGLSAGPPQRVLLRRLCRPSSTTSSARPAADGAHRLCLRPGPRRPSRGRRTARAAALPRQRARHGRQPPFDAEEIERCANRTLRPAGSAAGCRCGGSRSATVATTPSGLRPAVPGDGRSALRPGVARLDGVVRAAGGAHAGCRASIWRGAACIRGRACRWRRCRAGSRRPGLMADLASTSR